VKDSWKDIEMTESEVLFKITRDSLDTGLRGFPVGTCPNSHVDPMKGLFYGGYAIPELSEKGPEEVMYLLLKRELPTASQLASFKQDIIANSKLHPGVIEHLRSLPKAGHPMKWLLAAINVMGMYEGTGDYAKDYLNVLAQLPEAVAAIFRIRSGWGEPIASKPELGWVENFVHMLGAPDATPELVHMLRVFAILHFDHGGGNLSTFVGKAIASGHEDMYGSLVGAMAALAGPLHGMANQECLRFLKGISKDITDPSDEKIVYTYVENLLAKGGVLYGFGHAVLRVEDPRATVQYMLGEKIAPTDSLFRLAVTLRKVGSEILIKKGKAADPYPNVDAVSGCLLSACGLKDEEYYTVLFGLSRCVGIAGQIVWERKEARGGKGIPIVRPSYLYSGPVR
jgi:citrate synthase